LNYDLSAQGYAYLPNKNKGYATKIFTLKTSNKNRQKLFTKKFGGLRNYCTFAHIQKVVATLG
jgi:hypothetical protein